MQWLVYTRLACAATVCTFLLYETAYARRAGCPHVSQRFFIGALGWFLAGIV